LLSVLWIEQHRPPGVSSKLSSRYLCSLAVCFNISTSISLVAVGACQYLPDAFKILDFNPWDSAWSILMIRVFQEQWNFLHPWALTGESAFCSESHCLLPSWLWATAHTVPFPVKVRAWKGKQASKSFFQRVASYPSWKWQYPNFNFVLFSVFFKFCLLIIIVFYLRCKIQWRPSLTSITLLFF